LDNFILAYFAIQFNILKCDMVTIQRQKVRHKATSYWDNAEYQPYF
jgi:hypothetical protein